MAVKIKLKRLGKIRAPYYRIVVADARTKRDGRAIEEIGKYHPKAEPSFIEVDSERAQHWLSVGAQPTDPVRKIFEITGDWQKFKSLPGTEGTLKSAPPKEDRKEIFAAAVRETMAESAAPAKGRGRSSSAGKGPAAKETAAKETAGKETAGKEKAARETAGKEKAARETVGTDTAARQTAKTREKAGTQKRSEQPAKARSGDTAADSKGKGRARAGAKSDADSDTPDSAAAQAQAAEADPDAAASGPEPANGT